MLYTLIDVLKITGRAISNNVIYLDRCVKNVSIMAPHNGMTKNRILMSCRTERIMDPCYPEPTPVFPRQTGSNMDTILNHLMGSDEQINSWLNSTGRHQSRYTHSARSCGADFFLDQLESRSNLTKTTTI